MRSVALLALSFVLALPVPVLAEVEGDTVQSLLEDCNSTAAERRLYCLGMVGGVSGVMNSNCMMLETGNPSAPQLAASTGKITFGALEQAFKNWAAAHPEGWGYGATVGLMLSMRETFPCQA